MAFFLKEAQIKFEQLFAYQEHVEFTFITLSRNVHQKGCTIFSFAAVLKEIFFLETPNCKALNMAVANQQRKSY